MSAVIAARLRRRGRAERSDASDLLGARHFRYAPQLDGVRAFAVLGVIVQHAQVPFAKGGALGVDVFFVLSGFLITTLLLQEFDLHAAISLRTFYVRRIRRLLPALVAVAAFSAVAFAVLRPYKSDETLLGIGASLLYVSCWLRAFNVSELGWFGHTWSLSVEEHFYLVWPPVLLLICRKGLSHLRAWVVGIFAVAVAYRIGSALVGVSGFRLYNSPDMRAEQLLAGCALAAILAGGREQENGRWEKLLLGAVALSLLDLARSVAFGVSGYAGSSTMIALEAAVVIGYLMVRPSGPLSRLLSHRALVWVGRRSYAIYLWHLPMFGLFELQGEPTSYRVLGRAAAILLTFVAAWASFKWVETPLYRRRVEGANGSSATKSAEYVADGEDLAADTSGFVGPPTDEDCIGPMPGVTPRAEQPPKRPPGGPGRS